MVKRPKGARWPKLIIGWREWVGLPALDVEWIKVKVDTGARSSALHTFHVRTFRRGGVTLVRFLIHPVQRRRKPEIEAEALLHDERRVVSSSGHPELRPVIRTPVTFAGRQWPIDLTLTDRDVMGFRMLLGREALRGRAVIDPARSYTAGQPRWKTATSSVPESEGS